MTLHPDRGNVADHETDGGAGLNQHAGRDQLLHHHPGNRRAYRQLRADGRALLFGLIDLLRRDAEDFERLKAGLDVGGGIVVVRLAALVVLDRNRAEVQELFLADP